MSRTVKFSFQSFSASMLVLLWFLVGGLTVHFLIENHVFLSIQPDTASETVSYDELTHQDDLAISAGLPVQIPVNRPLFVLPAIPPSQVQAFFPLRQPPKI